MTTTVGPFEVEDRKTDDGRVIVDLHIQNSTIRMTPESMVHIGRLLIDLGESYYPPEELRR